MSKQVLLVLAAASLVLTMIPAAPARAQSVRVVVDGQFVALDQPPLMMAGRVLVPLRGVFERLGATVEWNRASNMITALRAGTQVQLAVGSRQAVVNGRAVLLDVPAILARGRTLVPLRFVSEAMGAQVDWDPQAGIVYITSGTVAIPPPGQPVQPVQPIRPAPAPAQPSVIEGRVLRVDVQAGRILIERDNLIHTFMVTPDTAITRIDATSGRGGAIALEQVRQGDFVRITADSSGRALQVRVAAREVTGRIDAITSRSVALADGQVFTFTDDTRFLLNGREVPREQVRAGMEVTLRLNPQTNQILAVEAQTVRGQPPQPVPAQPGTLQITSFAHNATTPLSAGSRVTVTMRGTPGGNATFDIFGVASGVPMREVAPGVYQGIYTIRSQDNVASAAVIGRLRVGGAEATLVQGATPVTIDGAPPRIVQRFPNRGQTVNNVRPNILIVFEDPGSAGIDPNRSRLLVNGRDVTAQASITETAMAYTPAEPLNGRVVVRAVLADKAGNVTEEEYVFNTAAPQAGSLLRSVTVSPATPLRPGDVLTVTAVGEPGGQAAFTIESIENNIGMSETQPGVYVGTHTVRRGERAMLQNARVIVSLTRGGVTSQAEASARLTMLGAETVTRPAITSPAPGTRVNSPIVIRGTAPAGHRVEVQVDYEGALLVFAMRGTYGQVVTTADANGNWAVTIRETVRIPNAELTITAVAIDPAGRRSEPVTLKAMLARAHDRAVALRILLPGM
jgi:hypothetical protein